MDEITYVPPISHKDVVALSSDGITKREYDATLKIIEERFNYVFRQAMHIMGRNVIWFDYDNEGGQDGPRGYFDPKDYRDEITFVGEFDFTHEGLYDNDIPTRWLWQEFEAALSEEVAQQKIKVAEKARRKQAEKLLLQQKYKDITASIKSKLTPEELTFITFNKIK